MPLAQGVTVAGLPVEAFQITFNLAAGITAADVGKLVAFSTAADNTVALPADDGVACGVLMTFEDRVTEGIRVGTVGLKGGYRVATTGAVTRGQTLVGSATAGIGKGATLAAGATNRVTAVGTGFAEVLFL